METVRKEILPGVWLTALENDKFKTGCLSISLLTQLDRETAAMNALIPYVLRRGSRNHTDMQALATELDGLYGSYIEPVVRRSARYSASAFSRALPTTNICPDGSGVLKALQIFAARYCSLPAPRAACFCPNMLTARRKSCSTA